MSNLQVSILTPSKVVARAVAGGVQLPGALGYMGILPGHARMIAELGVGELTLEGGEVGKQVYFVAGGYVDVGADQVMVLVDVAERPADIDVARAEKAKKRAAERLERKSSDIDMVRAQAALMRATQRLTTASRK